jgi:hypothetical protein
MISSFAASSHSFSSFNDSIDLSFSWMINEQLQTGGVNTKPPG